MGKEDWETHYTETGEAYYYNIRTDESTWDKPRELMTAQDLEEASGEWYWIETKENSWIPCRVVDRLNNGSLKVHRFRKQKKFTAKKHQIGVKIDDVLSLQTLTDDLVQLAQVHEASVIDLLRRRFFENKFYTGLGDILVAVNPFKKTKHFTPKEMTDYLNRGGKEMLPHPYLVIDNAYRDLCEYSRSQSLLISGESGAGKTYTVRVCLGYLSEAAGSPTGIERLIMAANPILEAFGNAKTLRNDNSSRFGKFIRMYFSERHQIIAASTDHYLLEKSRVVYQAKGERNFHIFYYLTVCLDKAKRKKLKLTMPPQKFHYVNQSGSYTAETHSDQQEFDDMMQAFEELHFTEKEQQTLFQTVAAVLWIGNIEFSPVSNTASKIKNPEALKNAAKLLKVDPDELSKRLTESNTKVSDGNLRRTFTPDKAIDARDALAKHLYSRMFDWLVERLNKCMMADCEGDTSEMPIIGMVDIFGFEIFKINSFEQLCINFANEKLQQMFNRHTFTLEEKTYEDEGIEFKHIEFHDSQPLLDMLGLPAKGKKLRHSIYGCLDDITSTNQTDDKFLGLIKTRFGKKKKLLSTRLKSRTAFKIFHYAGGVVYDSMGFVKKNADKLYDNLEDLMKVSENGLVCEAFGGNQKKVKRSNSGRKHTTKVNTAGGNFVKQLKALERTVNKTWPRFIRCIKPNQLKKGDIFNAPLSLEQLRFAGVFEAVTIRKRGYPFRYTHKLFFQRFRPILFKKKKKGKKGKKSKVDDPLKSAQQSSYRKASKKLIGRMAEFIDEAEEIQVGKTMCLYRAKQSRPMELLRLNAVNSYASVLQRHARGMIARIQLRKMKKVLPVLKKAIKTREEEPLKKALKKASGIRFKMRWTIKAENMLQAIETEKKLIPQIKKCLKMNMEKNFDEIDAIVQQMNDLKKLDDKAFKGMQAAQDLWKAHHVVHQKRKVKKEVKEAIEGIGNVNLEKSLMDVATAIKGIKQVQKDQDLPDFCKKEQKKLKKIKKVLQEEYSLMEEVFEMCRSEGPKGEKGKLDVSKMKPKNLKTKVKEAEEVAVAADSKIALEFATALVKMRQALKKALDSGNAKATDPEWVQVEKTLTEAMSCHAKLAEPVSEEEFGMIRGDLALRAQVEEVVNKLKHALQTLNPEELSLSNDQAQELDLENHRKFGDIAKKARKKQKKVDFADKAVRAALRPPLDVDTLRDAINASLSCNYGDEGKAGELITTEALQVHACVMTLQNQAAEQVRMLHRPQMESVVKGCREMQFPCSDADKLKNLLELSEREFTEKQLQAAMRVGDHARAVRVADKLGEIKFRDSSHRDRHDLKKCPLLKSPERFCKRLWGLLSFESLSKSMLHWVPSPIHTTLLAVEQHPELTDPEQTSELQRHACVMHKSILCAMGDRRYNNPSAIISELLTQGLSHQVIADEIFTQFAKQLTPAAPDYGKVGPSPQASALGWEVLGLCFKTFRPSSTLAPFLEVWIRKQRSQTKDVVLRLMHQSLLGGNMRAPPSVESVERALSRIRASTKNTSKRWRMSGVHENFDIDMALEDVDLDPVAIPYRVKLSRKKMINMAGGGSKGSSSKLSSKIQSAMRKSTTRRKSEFASEALSSRMDAEEKEEDDMEEDDDNEDENIKTYLAEFDYEAGDQDELTVSVGDVIKIDMSNEENQEDSGWFVGTNTNTGRSGLVPSNYLKLKPKKVKELAASKRAPPPKRIEPEPESEDENEEPEGEKYKAKFDFDSESPDELAFRVDDVIWCTKIPDPEFDGWMIGKNDRGQEGLVPENYLEPC